MIEPLKKKPRKLSNDSDNEIPPSEDNESLDSLNIDKFSILNISEIVAGGNARSIGIQTEILKLNKEV